MSTTATATPLREQVATEVRRELAAARMTPTELARRLGVSQTTVWRRVSGEVAFDVDDLQKIADILGVSVGRLLPRGVQTTEPYVALAERLTVGSPTPPTRPIDNRPSGRARPKRATGRPISERRPAEKSRRPTRLAA